MNKYNENLEISKKDYKLSNKEIFDILKNGKDTDKPIAILNFNKLNEKEAEKLVFYLTDQKGPIREAVSSILPDLCKKITPNMEEKILMGLLDVNPNVVRNLIPLLEESCPNSLQDKIWGKTRNVLEDIENECSKFRKNKEKNHVINKKIFHLYWLLETISIFCKNLDEEELKIIKKTSEFYDYTIREKTAQILNKVQNPPQNIIEKLKNDKNFYVRNKL